MTNKKDIKSSKAGKGLVAAKNSGQADEHDLLIENLKAERAAKSAARLRRSEAEARTVHTRSFPQERKEGWWVFVEDKSSETMMIEGGTLRKPDEICEDDELELQFMAPKEAGRREYVVWCRSDSVCGCDASVQLEVEVVSGGDVDGVQEESSEPSLRRRLKQDKN